MKILHTVQFYQPSIGGMQEVVQQISERLVKLGHDVTVVTTFDSKRINKIINGVEVIEFRLFGNLVQGIFGDVASYQEFLLNNKFDIITNFAAQQWATDVMLPILGRVKAKKVFVPTGFSGLGLLEYNQYFQQMKEWLKQYNATVFLANDYRDINFARENGLTGFKVIPNGASEEEFTKKVTVDIRKKLGIPKDHFLILHVGSHTGIKGHAEAIAIFEKAKLVKATFLIVANNYSKRCAYSCGFRKLVHKLSARNWRSRKKLVITSLNREDTIAAYHAADLFLFPSNLECSPIVLFECMASKTPFLTTDVGNAAEIIEWSGGGELLPTKKTSSGYSHAIIDDSVKMLEDLYHHPKQRQLEGLSGYKAWQDRFTWEKIALEYEKLYKNLLTN